MSIKDTMFEQLRDVPVASIVEKIHNKPLVIIYPRHRARAAFVSYFLQNYQPNVIYYNLTKKDNSLDAWLNNMLEEFNATLPVTFGHQTQAALEANAAPEDIASAFSADLKSLKANQFVVVLDSLDYLPMDDMSSRFFRALPSVLPQKVQIVISARLLDLKPWNDLVLANQAVVVGNEEALTGGIYGDEPRKGQLEVLALDGGFVYIDGKPVHSWDGSLPRHLFYYFVDHTMVTRDEIFSVFWPNMSIKEATNVFHVTKRKISERLGYELTNYSSGFYIPSSRLNVHYDVRVFENALTDAIENEQQAPADWYKAVSVYRTQYLKDVRTSWAESRRETLKHKYTQALIGLGRYHRGLGELDLALGYLSRAIREKPDWEDVHRDVIMIYYQQGRRDEAIQQYKQIQKTLQTMFNIQPSRETRNLYDVISAI